VQATGLPSSRSAMRWTIGPCMALAGIVMPRRSRIPVAGPPPWWWLRATPR